MVSNNPTCATGESGEVTGEHLREERSLSLLKAASVLPGKGPLSTMVMLLVLSDRLHRADHLLLLPSTLREFSLSRATAYRSLELLEQSGLVTVKRQKGRSPLVTFTLSSDTAAADFHARDP